jgi:speckle-type POZ protein
MLPDAVDLTEAARSEQLLKINAFTATKEKPGYTASKVCAVGGHDWRIEFHPKVKDSSNHYASNDYWIMFRVQLTSKSTSGVAASFSCRLMDPRRSGSYGSGEMIKSSMFYEGRSLDIFLIRSDLEGSRSEYVKDDCIFVQCAINVLLGEPNDPAAVGAVSRPVASVPSCDLNQQFGELLRCQKGADITFLVSGEFVKAHRSVLAARSPVFMAELFGDMKERASPCIEINDMDAEVFRTFLYFVYTDTIPILDQKGEHETLLAQHLLDAADRYGLERLKRICVEKVCTDISVDTVATTLALAEQHGCSSLKSKCLKFILATPENLYAVAATEGYKHLEASCPSILTELLKLMAKGNK